MPKTHLFSIQPFMATITSLVLVACSSRSQPASSVEPQPVDHHESSAAATTARPAEVGTDVAPTIDDPEPALEATSTETWEQLRGTPGSSARWGSGWLDLERPMDFRRGTKLRIKAGGTATCVVIRLLRMGQSGDDKDGIIDQLDVPEDGMLTLTLPADYPRIRQISVHGGMPWGSFCDGDNGAATFIKAEIYGPATAG